MSELIFAGTYVGWALLFLGVAGFVWAYRRQSRKYEAARRSNLAVEASMLEIRRELDALLDAESSPTEVELRAKIDALLQRLGSLCPHEDFQRMARDWRQEAEDNLARRPMR